MQNYIERKICKIQEIKDVCNKISASILKGVCLDIKNKVPLGIIDVNFKKSNKDLTFFIETEVLYMKILYDIDEDAFSVIECEQLDCNISDEEIDISQDLIVAGVISLLSSKN